MALDKALLYYFIRDAILPYSEDFRILDHHNPYQLELNKVKYSAHVSYVHDSGNARENDDEVRIQIGRSLIERQREQEKEGRRVAFLGFFENGEVFVAWDPRHIFSLQAEKVGSVYARQSLFDAVKRSQAAVHSFEAKHLGETSFAIALPASALGFYLENINHFHRLPSEGAIQQLVTGHQETFSVEGMNTDGEITIEVDGHREKFEYTRTSYPRDPKFKNDVLVAYGNACCVCGRQLGLVQAAHIVPHSDPECQSIVHNGLALCVEHHKLYDDALLLPGPDRQLVFNHDRAAYLNQIGQEKGLDAIRELSRSQYKHPAEPKHRPRNEYLERGLKIRMGG